MPIYEYACKSCKHTLDALQKMSDDPLLDCPECGKPELKRLISAPRFRLKGQGWYETDFKKDNQRNLAKGDSEAAKPAAKSDKKDVKDSTKKESTPKATAKKESS
jgi:putative FmdB family regulatory protein